MVGFVYSTYFGIIELKEIYNNKKYKIEEGVIKNYIPEVQKKHNEIFQVNDVNFSISSNTYGNGFNTTGIFYNGLKVKIYYIEDESFSSDKMILRVDIDVSEVRLDPKN